MPIADRILRYSVSVLQSDVVTHTRQIRLTLESGGTAAIQFPPVRPNDWLQLFGSTTNVFMPAEQFDDVYRVLRSESPVFLTALNIFGFQVGSVHTELDLAAGETPGEGDQDPQSLEALVRRARRAGTDRT